MSTSRDSHLESTRKREAILRRLKGHLLSQKNKFYYFEGLLDQEEIDIADGDFLKLKIHTEMEKEVLNGINALQKVLTPLEDMYRRLPPPTDCLPEAEDLPDLRKSIAGLKDQVQDKMRRNRRLLSERMEEIQKELLAVRRPFHKNSQFLPVQPSLIDITT